MLARALTAHPTTNQKKEGEWAMSEAMHLQATFVDEVRCREN